VFSPRNLMVAGVVLIAVALGASGHGFWWLFGLLWVLPHAGRRHHGGHRCGGASRHGGRSRYPQDEPARTRPTSSQPDPTQDRHEAFPAR